ncbi:MAG: 2-oxoacid:acceptor oxidoreductase subunit alpha [Sedimentisphaerales bacterium]|nr:2-oxoacid:acceptor oxidoreductase subunit alpha [Sedimentisphaerales bacterium]
MNATDQNDFSIVLCGQAGQGIQTVETLLMKIFKASGLNIFATKEYMSRVRGGLNSTQIRVSSEPVRAFVNRTDLLVALDKGAIEHLSKRIGDKTVILIDEKSVPDKADKLVKIPLSELANQAGGKIYANSVAVGIITGLFDIDQQLIEKQLSSFFSKKDEDVVNKNTIALKSGYEFGKSLVESNKIEIPALKSSDLSGDIVINGAQAVSIGAIACGCNFISAYPMSPSTGVLVFLSKNSKEFGIVAEQAEDEIAAINMAIGAWYAGARAMVTTSGGGFALMTEGVSLAGMLETPIVVHLAQRPGPATGLPTRTEQADLELALYAGHGEFPRIIFAPGTLRQAFELTAAAFNLADKYQIPVIILTDQYLIDSNYNIPRLNIEDIKIERFITESKADYERYEPTKDGISPRAIPGFGKGLVAVDSDEHNTEGHITEDLDLRVKMVDKRLAKLKAIKNEVVAGELWPGDKYKNLVVCWGSTYPIVKEALTFLSRDDTAMLHLAQVYPLHEDIKQLLQKAEKVTIIESNATGQLAKLIKLSTGFEIENKILKYSGLSFSVEEVTDALGNWLKEKE